MQKATAVRDAGKSFNSQKARKAKQKAKNAEKEKK